MITRIVDTKYINDFIIKCLKSIIKRKKKYNKTFRDPILGLVTFIKNNNDTHINIHLVNCRYGYDFFNQDNLNTKNTNECCVCFEETHNIIQCGHILCPECISNIMKYSKKMICPLCRKNHENINGLIIKYPLHLVTLLSHTTI